MKLRLLKLLILFLFIGSVKTDLYAHSIIEEYGLLFGVPPELLWAIIKVESNFNPNAISENKNGTKDIGLMQVNTVHLDRLEKKYGIQKADLLDTRINIAIGAQILSKCLKKHGYNEKGINCYNGRTTKNSYAKKVLHVVKTEGSIKDER